MTDFTRIISETDHRALAINRAMLRQTADGLAPAGERIEREIRWAVARSQRNLALLRGSARE